MSNNSSATHAELLAKGNAACYPYTPGIRPPYGYFPSEAAGIVFCVLFGIPLLYHTFQSIRLRAATAILLALGALTEVIGWASRAYSSHCPYNGNAFLSQEVTLIIAPVFLSAALYILLGLLIVAFGPASSILSPKWYTIVFCTCDIISLVVQAIGGAKASTADYDEVAQKAGTHIMIAGIAFQLFTMTLFVLLVIDFLRRVTSSAAAQRGTAPVTRGARLVLVAMVVSCAMIYIRGVYRTIELAQGWTGYLITHEGYFIGLDAAIMVVAVAVFVVIDPAVVFRKEGWLGYGGLASAKASRDVSDTEAGIALGSTGGTYMTAGSRD